MHSGLSRELMAMRVAQDLRDGQYVNLGIGLPTMVSNFIPDGVEVMFQTENGCLGYGPIAQEDEIDFDFVNAGGQPLTLLPGGCFFHHADSFAMIRGGHIDVTVLGGYQVSEKGDLANWKIPGQKGGSIGGAMDLVTGSKRVIVIMEHTSSSGEPRIVIECTYPLTGKGVVNDILTNLALIEVTSQGLLLKEVASGVNPEEVQRLTEPKLIISKDLREMEF